MRGRFCLLLVVLMTLFMTGTSHGYERREYPSGGVAFELANATYPMVALAHGPPNEVTACSNAVGGVCVFFTNPLAEMVAEFRRAQIERREELRVKREREAKRRRALELKERERKAREAGIPFELTGGKSARFVSENQASIPRGAPPKVKDAIEAANAIADTPYLWGGGHGSFESSGYDCSGAVSYALHAGGWLETPLDSTGLETWGEAGAGQWITVYANSGHTWVLIAGLAFDTSGGAGPRWHETPVYTADGFIVRHPPGY